ncbi:MAG TPA: protein kinase [Polyangiaceae bacterium]
MGKESGNDRGPPDVSPRDDFSTAIAPESARRPSRPPTASQVPRSIGSGTSLADGRFRLRRRLGSGGMGVVYEAFDAAQDTLVALKTLSQVDPSSLYFLKNEFRALADVVHPNLVGLHGMFSDGDHWFITMELVHGVSFVEHIRGGTTNFPADEETMRLPVEALTGLEVRESVLRAALLQLASGAEAIHAAGKVHRDLKPSNVLVTPHGRVVILDFGLAAEAAEEAIGQTIQGGLLGTPAYMAPELLIGMPATPASDWYAVGVMLYQSLVGELPYKGRFHEVFAAKQREPPRPSALVPGVSLDLDELCIALLARDAAVRPSGKHILEWLMDGGAAPSSSLSPSRDSGAVSRLESPFVGRAEELSVLEAALLATGEGKSVAVLVSGTSGMGKTALVDHFLAGVRDRGQAVVLAGRCYERESVAFKAIDPLIDSLTRHLRRSPAADTFLPRDLRALVRVFPVLERVEAITEAPQRRALPADPQELRRRAFGALREMFGRIADRSPLVVFVDDLQWGDVDSAEVIREILAPPDAPAMLFVGTCRSDEREGSPCIQALMDRPSGASRIEWVELPVGMLGDAEATELAGRLLGDAGSAVEAVRREGRGSPFFITELVRYLEQRVSGDDASSAGVLTLDRALQRRVSRLPETTRRALEVMSVAARPLSSATIATATALGAEAHAALRQLTSLKLARRVGADDSTEYTTYHDRIREAVAGRLPQEELTAIHRSLADTLERDGSGDLDALTEHLLSAGETVRAAQYAVRAAALAQAALAFDRAARLYTVAIDHGVLSLDRVIELRGRLGDVFVAAGRSTEAAHVFLEAAKEAGGPEAVAFRRRAAEQLILAGHLDAGLGMLRDMASDLGLQLPASQYEADAGSFAAFAALRERGFDYVSKDESEVSGDVLSRLDLSNSLALAQLTVDTTEGMLWTLRHLLAALDAGEPRRVHRGLSLYAMCSGGILPTEGVLDRVEALGATLDAPEVCAWSHMTRGVLPYWKGGFLEAADEFERAEAVFRDDCRASSRDLAASRLMLTSALWHAEEVVRVSSLGARCLADARERKDLYLLTWCHVRAHCTRLAEDQPDVGYAEVKDAVLRWGRERVDFIAWQSALALSMIERYRGGTGWEHITRQWTEIQGNPGFSQCPVHRALTRREHAFAALASASGAVGTFQEELLRAAAEDADIVAETGILGGASFRAMVQGAIAAVRGDAGTALSNVTAALAGYEARPLYALTTELLRRQRGMLLGGDEGRGLVLLAERTIAEKGVRNVAGWARTFLPGFGS